MLLKLRQRVSYAYALALVTLYLLFLPLGGYARMMEGKYHLFLLLSLAYVLAMTLLGAWRAVRWRNTTTLAALAYLALTALSAALSPYGSAVLLGGTRRDGLVTVTLYVAVYLLLARFLRADRRLLDAAVWSAALSAVLSLVQLVGKNPFYLYPEGLTYFDGDAAYVGFYAGTSGNIDFTAFTLALAAAAAAAAVVRLRRYRLLPPLALLLWALARLSVALALTALAVTAAAALPLLFPRRRRAMCALAAALALAALVGAYCYCGENQTLFELSRLLHGEWDGSFGSARLMIWEALVPLIAARPLLGGGCGTLYLRGLEPFYRDFGSGLVHVAVTSAHNEYLGILVDQGALALAAFLVLLALSLRRAWSGAERARTAVCGTALLCYLVMALFSVASCITSIYLWLLLALLAQER